MIRFDPQALYSALDQQRETRGLTWAQVAREIGVSAATIARTKSGGRFEVDGMLAMVGWLNRPVEDFVKRTRGRQLPANSGPIAGPSIVA